MRAQEQVSRLEGAARKERFERSKQDFRKAFDSFKIDQ